MPRKLTTVAPQDLTGAYRDMAADEVREAEAHEWAETTAKDIADEASRRSADSRTTDGPADSQVAQEWDAELLRRMDELEAGTAPLIDRSESSAACESFSTIFERGESPGISLPPSHLPPKILHQRLGHPGQFRIGPAFLDCRVESHAVRCAFGIVEQPAEVPLSAG